MSNSIYLSGPMGNGIRPKKYFGATRELIRLKVLKSNTSTEAKDRQISSKKLLKTAC